MILLIDKPKGMTSHDVVDYVRRITGERRVGHAGTLDPNATGLLIVGVTREDTKKLGEITKNTTKEYIADIFLGEERDTDDSEGKIVKKSSIPFPDEKQIKKTLSSFLGVQNQIPPKYSAIKLSGKVAYKEAREGREINLSPREVTIHSIELLDIALPLIKLKISVSSGTYIRAIARDLGEKLGTFAYLKDLRRTKIGEYKIEDAKNLDDLKDNLR